MLRSVCLPHTAGLAAFLALGACGRPVPSIDDRPLGVDDDTAGARDPDTGAPDGESPGDTDGAPDGSTDGSPADDPSDDEPSDVTGGPGDDEPSAPLLPLTVRFLEPGQHVVLNVQVDDTVGQHHLVTLPSEVVPDPFLLEDAAAEEAREVSARLEVQPGADRIVVSGIAAASVDDVVYAVAQAGPLGVEVCAHVSDASVVRMNLRCEATLKVLGAGIAAVTASRDGETWCNGVNLSGDVSLIPFSSPTDAARVLPVVDGQACWQVDLYVGAGSDDDGTGSSEARGVFTFTAIRG